MDDILGLMGTPFMVPTLQNQTAAVPAWVITFAFPDYNPRYGTKQEQLERHLQDFLLRGDHFVLLKEDASAVTLFYLPRETVKLYQERLQAVVYQFKMNVLFYEQDEEGREALAESQAVLRQDRILLDGSVGFQTHLDAVAAVFYRPKGSPGGFLARTEVAGFVWPEPDSPLQQAEEMVRYLEGHVKEYGKSQTEKAVEAWQRVKDQLDALFVRHG